MRPPGARNQTDNLDTLFNLSFYGSYESGIDPGMGRGRDLKGGIHKGLPVGGGSGKNVKKRTWRGEKGLRGSDIRN